MIVLLSSFSSAETKPSPELVRLRVYPNPSHNGLFQVDLQQKTRLQEVEIVVYNLIGVPVYRKRLSSPQSFVNHQINLSHLARGMYMLEVRSGGHKQTRRISFV